MRLGATARDVLLVMAADPTGRFYGLQLCAATKRKSGTLYPALNTLERDGLVTSYWEEADPSVKGRPRRRYYQLSAEGASVAAAVRSEMVALMRPVLRPAT